MEEEKRDSGTVPIHETYIDYSSKSDEELRKILEELLREEKRISYQRRILHGKIDLLRAELVRRRKEGLRRGRILFNDDDIRRLSEILAGEALGVSRNDPTLD
ncbi:RsiG family protein [Candidatus Solincola sp.]|jgi:hypothetical protein|nr:hypothetical protein [Actinomycetota bacterium]MDI7253031.1 hypothetical protein [Actinomycetota bacterium]